MQNRETALIHYGIKGQKWGVRRFQDENKKLTEAGKKRYGGSDHPSFGAKAKKKIRSIGSAVKGKVEEKIDEHQKKNPKNMSDEELQERINRLRKETEYKRLTDELNRKPNQNNRNNQNQGSGKKNKDGGKGGKKHPYLALALLTPVASAIGLATSALTKDKIASFMNDHANVLASRAADAQRNIRNVTDMNYAQRLLDAASNASHLAEVVSNAMRNGKGGK